MNKPLALAIALAAACACSGEMEYLWSADKMPDAQTNQFARMRDERFTTNSVAYIDWYATPSLRGLWHPW